MLDLHSFLVSLYVLVDDWWKLEHSSEPPRAGRPALLTDPEVITLAILAQWPRFRSERDFWRFAWTHLREYFPTLCSQGQFNRRVRALEPELRALQRSLADELSGPSAVYHVMDTTLIPAIVRVRASRKGLFCGQATFGRSASKTEWVYGFKVALVVDPGGVITAFGLAAASSEERPIADALVASDRHEAYLADKGFTGVEWERRWLEEYGALVAATPYYDSRQASDHRRGDLPTEGLLLCGAPSGEDVGRATGAPEGQGRSVYLRPANQRFARPATSSPGEPVDLTYCTSLVLELRQCEVHRHLTLAGWARRQRALLSRPTPRQRTPITLTGWPFSVRREPKGMVTMRPSRSTRGSR